MAEKFRAGRLSGAEIAHLRDELDAMAAAGALSPPLRTLRGELDRPPPAAAAPAAASAEGRA
jgi:hypothetical protein